MSGVPAPLLLPPTEELACADELPPTDGEAAEDDVAPTDDALLPADEPVPTDELLTAEDALAAEEPAREEDGPTAEEPLPRLLALAEELWPTAALLLELATSPLELLLPPTSGVPVHPATMANTQRE